MLSETPAAEPYGVSFRDLLETVPKVSLAIRKAPIHTQGNHEVRQSTTTPLQREGRLLTPDREYFSSLSLLRSDRLDETLEISAFAAALGNTRACVRAEE